MRKLGRIQILAILTGVLVTVAVLYAGTFAWFTDRAEGLVEGSFNTAQVRVNAEEMSFAIYDFFPGDYPLHQTISRQRTLEETFSHWWNNRDSDRYSEYFGMGYAEARYNLFWGTMPPAFGGWDFFADVETRWPEVNIFTRQEAATVDLIAGAPEFGNNRVNFIRDAMNRDDNHVFNVTPSSIFAAAFDFSIKHDDFDRVSTIPVYFRIPALALSSMLPANTELAFIQSVTAIISGDDTVRFRIPLGYADGWFYCPVPLSPEYGWDVEVGIYAYISGAYNGNDLQFQHFDLAGLVDDDVIVEIIQATNNAVFMVDGWSDAAMLTSIQSIVSPGPPGLSGTFFIPYVQADLYGAYLEAWGYPRP